ncbi:MAG: phage major capsid protein [Carnobacterium sp.]|uniref:phage major capsid protein n=1 Tax=Carnobacterium sp. TaxID=48221 RepID=UPI002FC78618
MVKIKDSIPKTQVRKMETASLHGFDNSERTKQAMKRMNEFKRNKKLKQRKSLEKQRQRILNSITDANKPSQRNKVKPKKNMSKRTATLNYLAGILPENQARSLGVEINNGKALIEIKLQMEILSYLQENNPLRKVATIHRGKEVKGIPIQVQKANANTVITERDESSLIPFTDVEFEDYYLNPIEFDAMAKISQKLEHMTHIEIANFMVEELSKAYLRKEISWFISSSVNQGSLSNKAVKFVPQRIEPNPYMVLVSAKNALTTAMQKKATWLINRAAQTQLESLLDSNGKPILKESANDDFTFTLFNKHVEVSDTVDKHDASIPVIYYGDFSYYHIQDVLGMLEVEILEELFTTENKNGYKIYNISDGQLVYGPFEVPVFEIVL